ncbi:pleckstrin homology domain-containing family M member 2-like [Physella acuta]|uniref:pleckstrin homology domain-containing family M member 2-like n=1 Tax=Physella acuta TaxID=109671 RepID=UPI0027DCBA22|nr:pleckstrin homology domain-containing family M member 2-like [Physella acuta]
MARPADRMRLKDKIIDNISKAIKSIQELIFYQSKDPVLSASGGEQLGVTLSNGDRPCHKLCEHLDHALLHGLKQVTHGYWRVVKQLSHKGMVRDIDMLINVTTDLGRGRAWMFASLNEGLLESYIKLLGDSTKLLKKYYDKDALVLDEDRMNRLLTLASGLECVTFRLEYDLPYLDLNAYPPRSRTDSEQEGDVFTSVPDSGGRVRTGSLRSASEFFPSSPDSYRLPSDSDSASTASLDTHVQSESALQMRASTYSSDSGFPSEAASSKQRSVTPTDVFVNTRRSGTPSDTLSLVSIGSEPDRHQRLESILPAYNEDADGNTESLEVIRVVKNKKASSNKTKKKKVGSHKKETTEKNTVTTEKVESVTPIQVDVDTSSQCVQNTKQDAEIDTVSGSKDVQMVNGYKADCDRSHIPQYDSGVDICGLASDVEKQDVSVSDAAVAPAAQTADRPETASQPSAFSQIESKIAELCAVKTVPSSQNHVNSEVKKQNGSDNKQVSKQDKNVQHAMSSTPPKPVDSTSQNGHHDPDSKKDIGHSESLSNRKLEKEEVKKSDQDEDFDFYSVKRKEGSESKREFVNSHSVSNMQDYMNYILQPESPPTYTECDQPTPYNKLIDLHVDLDNNSKLQIMLDILTHEDEKFVKMFATRENLIEGDAGIVYVLVSDQCLYLLKYRAAARKFQLHSSALLVDLIFISTGLNDQTMNIESRGQNKQKQRLWITPGHQQLTKAILACLTEQVKLATEHITSGKSRFSVGSEVPLQKIALRKYISKELTCESTDVTIDDYSLVFWEDPSSGGKRNSDTAYKEGTLLLQTQDPVKGLIWKPVYVVLKNSMLTVSNNKSDLRPQSYLGLGGDQCVGCRLTSQGDRSHCVELIIAKGGSWFLAAATEHEISDWRNMLCLAVSLGTVHDDTLRTCVPCCAVLACANLFLCHEDLQTKFFRTLGRAQVVDVTSIRIDEEDPTYCVIEFESQEARVSSNEWVFYFASAQDLDRYKSAICKAWKEIFLVELPILPLDKIGLQRNCHSHSQHLQQQLCFR